MAALALLVCRRWCFAGSHAPQWYVSVLVTIGAAGFLSWALFSHATRPDYSFTFSDGMFTEVRRGIEPDDIGLPWGHYIDDVGLAAVMGVVFLACTVALWQPCPNKEAPQGGT